MYAVSGSSGVHGLWLWLGQTRGQMAGTSSRIRSIQALICSMAEEWVDIASCRGMARAKYLIAIIFIANHNIGSHECKDEVCGSMRLRQSKNLVIIIADHNIMVAKSAKWKDISESAKGKVVPKVASAAKHRSNGPNIRLFLQVVIFSTAMI